MAFSKVPIGISALLSALSAFLIGISIGILPSVYRHFSDRANFRYLGTDSESEYSVTVNIIS
jgi:hypothetical protein